MPAAEALLHLCYGGQLLLVQGLEVLHKADVFPQLRQIAHAGQDHDDAGKAGGKADGIAGGTAAVEGIQHVPGLLGQVHQIAALYGLHDDDGLVMFAADLIAQTALHDGVVVVHIVELDLHHLDLGVLRQDMVQHLRPVMERDAHMANLALGFQGEGGLIGPVRFEIGELLLVLGVHEIKVKVVHAAGLQLTLEEGADVRLRLKEKVGQLVGEHIPLPGIAAGETGLGECPPVPRPWAGA